ncbi:hypothetical protein D5S18_17035 [Nocardia panacis]|uniref:Tetracycline repressor TetR C-terminal domain-containing protein n=1 Tax=Nocardia panacis TaxID=2340916 RepID=A0A3A4K7S9_9NOCA|nr:hypothetical protein [Nocardia panacis]RJO75084.1 hypothetical protein D5S18_17035 [Nocardia panacis]
MEQFEAAGIPRDRGLMILQSVGVFVLGHSLAQVGTPPGVEQAAPDPAPAYYDEWFETGLRAMVTGFQQQHE